MTHYAREQWKGVAVGLVGFWLLGVFLDSPGMTIRMVLLFAALGLSGWLLVRLVIKVLS